jgi:hypothetical protein
VAGAGEAGVGAEPAAEDLGEAVAVVAGRAAAQEVAPFPLDEVAAIDEVLLAESQ